MGSEHEALLLLIYKSQKLPGVQKLFLYGTRFLQDKTLGRNLFKCDKIMYKCLPLEEMLHFRRSHCSTNSNIGQSIGNQFLVAERNSTSDPVCLFVCLSVPNYVPNFFTSSRRSLRWMSLTKATYLLQQKNKIYYGWLSWAVPHSDLN